MNDSDDSILEGEFDLRDNKVTLLIMVVVPVILSLALVATAIVFGRPLDSAQVLTDSPELTSVHRLGDSVYGAETDEINPSIAEPVVLLSQPPPSEEGYDISELIISSERAPFLGLFGGYTVW